MRNVIKTNIQAGFISGKTKKKLCNCSVEHHVWLNFWVSGYEVVLTFADFKD